MWLKFNVSSEVGFEDATSELCCAGASVKRAYAPQRIVVIEVSQNRLIEYFAKVMRSELITRELAKLSPQEVTELPRNNKLPEGW